jgi:hypothetical protein
MVPILELIILVLSRSNHSLLTSSNVFLCFIETSTSKTTYLNIIYYHYNVYIWIKDLLINNKDLHPLQITIPQ